MESIFKSTHKDWQDTYRRINAELDKNTNYKEADGTVNNIINALKEIGTPTSCLLSEDLDDCSGALAVCYQEAGYNVGFADAVKMMVACMSNGEVNNDNEE